MDWFWRRTQRPSADTDETPQETPSTLLPALENSSTCLRLLTIDQRGSVDDLGCCSLRTYRLQNAPPYTAISYAWRRPRPPETRSLEIMINGFPKHVRFDLYAFLEYVSIGGILRSWCQRHLWIDALCINQEDNVEKADQVSMMGGIYSAAFSVCAWLGLLPNDDDWNAWGSWWSWRKGSIFLPNAETSKDLGLWDRMWVVQEIKSAQRLAFACGGRLATAQQFKMTVGKNDHHCSWVFDNSLTKHHTSLNDWIINFHSFDCSDARDKIFAFQNLVPESQRTEVDYSVTFAELYLLVLDRQFSDLREKMFEEIKKLHVFLATSVINLLDAKSMHFGEKYMRMAADQVIHLEVKVESVVIHTHIYVAHSPLNSSWPSNRPYDYAFSYPPQPPASVPDDYSGSPILQGARGIEWHSRPPSLKPGEQLEEAYTKGVKRGKLGSQRQEFDMVTYFVLFRASTAS